MKLSANLNLDRCPHCTIDTPNLASVHSVDSSASDGTNRRRWIVYVCRRCGGVVTAWAVEEGQQVGGVFPDTGTSVAAEIPSPAHEYLQQAKDSMKAPSGAIMLAASAVDAMLKIKGHHSGKLYSRIDAAAKDHLITDDMKKWAHKVRLDANNERHADESKPLPTMEDARHTIQFATALADFLFVFPARVESGLLASGNSDEGDS